MRLKASALAVALAVLPLAADAAGLGKLTVLSVLGQALRAELDISASREELVSLSARMAAPEAFKQAGIEYAAALSGIRFNVDQRADGQAFLRLSSERSINEPFLDMLVELNWASGRLVREYTFLLDPPEFLQKPVAVPATLPAARTPSAAAVAPVGAPTPAAAKQPSPPPPSPRVAEAKPVVQERIVVPTRVVQRGDTLAKIAREVKPEGVSLDQVLVALFSHNKDAFEGGNMNRLVAGKILSIPAAEAASSVSQSEAKKTVVAQSADFEAYRRKLAGAVATAVPKETPAKQSVSGKILPRVEDKAQAKAAGSDKLEVSTAAKDGKTAAGKAGSVRMTAIEEDLVARDKALKEANSRIAELEKNLNDLRKLVELKSQGMVDLQKQAEAQAVKPATPAVPAPALPAAAAPVKATEQPVTPAVAVAEASKGEPVVDKPVEQAPSKPAPPLKLAPPAKPLLPPAPPPSFVEDNPALVYGGGGIIALLLGYLGFSVWRRRQLAAFSESDHTVIEPNVPAHSVFGATGGQSVDTSQSSLTTDFSQSGMAALDSDEGVDPVAEADVYMAYGRDTQAEEILLEAQKADPTRPAIQLKLLEIYAARKSLKPFAAVAGELYRQTGGTGPDWEKAAILVQKIDPENPLYGRKTVPDAPEAPRESKGSSLSLPAAEGARLTLPGELAQIYESIETQPLARPGFASPATDEHPSKLDFDLDLGMPEPAAGLVAGPVAEPASMAPPAAEMAVPEDMSLDFELSPGGSDQGPAYSGMETLVMPSSMTESEVESPADIDLDLSVPAKDQPAAAEELMMIELTSTGLNVPEIDLGADEAAVAAQPATQLPQVPAGVDLSKISLDFDALPAAEPAESIEPAVPGTPVAAFEEVATKLELAHAYEEMGDKEGARELLQEVAKEGNSDQQAVARTRLAQLA